MGTIPFIYTGFYIRDRKSQWITQNLKVLRYIDPLTRVKTRAWIKKYYFLTKFLKSILISWSLSFPQCVLLDKFHS